MPGQHWRFGFDGSHSVRLADKHQGASCLVMAGKITVPAFGCPEWAEAWQTMPLPTFDSVSRADPLVEAGSGTRHG